MLFHSKLLCFIENPYTSLCVVCTKNKPLTHFLTPVEATWFCQAYHVRLAASHIASPSDRLQPNNTAKTKQHIQLIHKQPKKCNNKQQQQQQQQQQQHARTTCKNNMQEHAKNAKHANKSTESCKQCNTSNKCKQHNYKQMQEHSTNICLESFKAQFLLQCIHASSFKGSRYKANGALYHPRA
jgi:hypothetical protein